MSPHFEPRPHPAWASKRGHIAIRRLAREGTLNRHTDRDVIVERVARYGWAYDERDCESLGDCFTEDGVWEGSVMGVEPVGPFEGRQAVVDYLAAFWDVQQDQRRHMFTNVIVDELTDTEAVAYAYLLLTASSDDRLTPVATGPYRFLLARQVDSWRIRRLTGGWDTPF